MDRSSLVSSFPFYELEKSLIAELRDLTECLLQQQERSIHEFSKRYMRIHQQQVSGCPFFNTVAGSYHHGLGSQGDKEPPAGEHCDFRSEREEAVHRMLESQVISGVDANSEVRAQAVQVTHESEMEVQMPQSVPVNGEMDPVHRPTRRLSTVSGLQVQFQTVDTSPSAVDSFRQVETVATESDGIDGGGSHDKLRQTRAHILSGMGAAVLGVRPRDGVTKEEEDLSFILTFCRKLDRIRARVVEPKRTGFFADLERHRIFTYLTFFMIGLNGILVVYQTDKDAGFAFEAFESGQPHHPSKFSFDMIAEYFFAFYFTMELLMRLSIHKLYFFVNSDCWWNIFDFVAIVASVIDAITQLSRSGETTDSNSLDINLLRVLRVFKMTRGLRVLRALHFIQSLRQLVNCIVSSFSGLFWCLVLLIFLTGIFAVFIMQCVTFYMLDMNLQEQAETVMIEELGGIEAAVRIMRRYFGDMLNAMLTLTKATSGGDDWGFSFELLKITGVPAPFIMGVYILFFIIAAWNIVTSLFVEKALSLAQPDIETQMMNRVKQNKADAEDLLKLITAIDDDRSGTINIEEFSKWFEDEKFVRFLEFKGIDVKDAEMFFLMLEAAARSPEVDIGVIVNGMMRMRGVATNLDLHTLNFTINNVYAIVSKQLDSINQELRELQSGVGGKRSSTRATTASSTRAATANSETPHKHQAEAHGSQRSW